MKTLVICPGSETCDDALFLLMDPETGEALNHHVCSDAFYAKDDLYYRQSEVGEKIRERYGDDVDVKFIDETDINEDDLFIKNREFYKQSEEE